MTIGGFEIKITIYYIYDDDHEHSKLGDCSGGKLAGIMALRNYECYNNGDDKYDFTHRKILSI